MLSNSSYSAGADVPPGSMLASLDEHSLACQAGLFRESWWALSLPATNGRRLGTVIVDVLGRAA